MVVALALTLPALHSAILILGFALLEMTAFGVVFPFKIDVPAYMSRVVKPNETIDFDRRGVRTYGRLYRT
jgi:hypothetical protein